MARCVRPGDASRRRQEGNPGRCAQRAEHPPIAGLPLEISGLSKRFGGVQALDGVAFSVPAGSCCAIVGPNGSGKTTLLNLASGYYKPDAGSVKIGGVETLGSSAQKIAARGIGRTFQTPRLVAGLTALDNVVLGAYMRERASLLSIALRLPYARAEARRLREEALGFLHFVGVADRAETEAGETPHGQQRLIEIARAMMGGARLILLDEPAAGLSMAELDRLERLIRRICELGATIVIVEHHLDLVANIASHVTVLDRGTVLAAGKPAAVFNDDARHACLYGRTRAESRSIRMTTSGTLPLLSARNVDAGYGHVRVLEDVSIAAGAGRIVALVGRNGAGKSTLLRTLSGLNRPTSGEILFNGHNIAGARPYAIVAAGLLHVAEGRRLFRRQSVADNIELGRYGLRLNERAASTAHRSYP